MTERTARQAYTELQKLAREQGRNTQQLFELYVHERFLARVAASQFADRFVLKGGMLLAVLDTRRATRDADMLALGISNDPANLKSVVAEIAGVAMEDGVNFDVSDVTTQFIREEADYHGVRVSLPAGIGGARLKLKLDLSFGDPVAPVRINYPTLLDDPDFPLLGYPVESVIAEKAETMMFLGDANTRDRDFGDIYMLSSVHEVDGASLREALQAVSEHRGHEMLPLGPLLRTLPDTRQRPWEAFRERVGLPGVPASFAEVVDAVVLFIDPVLDDGMSSRWQPAERRWA